ncbi:sensor histidine kinase [Algihabitans albus]|uniref:sensor histidine kinase n=1 Tax=Algihabitans albus TaxID=2164067 RepID=UPI0013C34144|nr:ATP-binding protein [Algihabitans albus]
MRPRQPARRRSHLRESCRPDSSKPGFGRRELRNQGEASGSEAGVLLFSLDGRRVLHANEVVADLTGYTPSELCALSPGQLLAGPEPAETWRLDSEFVMLRPRRGDPVACRVSLGRLSLPEGERLVATLRPTPETEGQQRFDTLVRIAIEQLPEALVIYDTEDRLVYFNRAYHDFFPYMPSFEVLAGRHFFDIVRYSMEATGVVLDPLAERDPEAYFQKRLERLHKASGVPFEQETAGCWHLVHEQRVPGVGFVSLRRDITEMKRLHDEMAAANLKLAEARETAESARQHAEEANRSKSEFLAMMSHELRTPLNAILGFSSLLSEEYLGPLGSERYLDYARSIHESGAHLLSIINDILDLAKVEAGKMEIDPEPLDAQALIEECVSLVSGLAEGRGLEVESEVATEGLKLMADRRAAKQMIVNLLSNACKFTEAGGSVQLRAAPLDLAESPDAVTVSVRDTGVGMTPEDIAIAVEPFGQIGNVSTSGRQGTGLGLPLVKSFIELHGGSLEIQSELGKGTMVKLMFRG